MCSQPLGQQVSREVSTIRLSKGLDLPIAGAPDQQIIDDSLEVTRVALVGPDYHGMKPTMEVEVGGRVKAGQVVFSDKKTPGVLYTAPGAGKVTAINRGERRAFLSIEIELDGDECETFPSYTVAQIGQLDRQAVVDNLVKSGFWTAFRTRPFGRVPSPDTTPTSIFVTAIDTNPLAADPRVVLAERANDFRAGLAILSRLGAEWVYLCKAAGVTIPGEEMAIESFSALADKQPVAPGTAGQAGSGTPQESSNPQSPIPNPQSPIHVAEFAGPHPAGLAGTHIHFLDPIGPGRTVWHVNYQDVAAFGRLFLTGLPDFERVVSLAGPGVAEPRLVRTRIGANLSDLTAGQLLEGTQRVVSGSVLYGRKSERPTDYLGRYHQQVSVLSEVARREFFGWIMPGFDRFSLLNVVASKLLLGKRFPMTTAMYGGHRAIVPMDMYEKVMPLDILPTFLFKALSVGDIEQAESLGCLELDEEDLALCTFVCPGKGDHGVMLRKMLTEIEKEG